MTERQIQVLICKPAAEWREDFAHPACSDWIYTYGASFECDGDVLKFTKPGVANWCVFERSGLNINTDDYPYIAFRAKKDPNLVGVTKTYIDIFEDPPWTWVASYEFTETEFTIHAHQMPAGKTITGIRLVFENAGVIVGSMWVDFILFTSVNPFYSEDDLGDVFDIPRYEGGVNDKTDFLQFIIDNHEGQHKARFAYRDEAYLWVKKNGEFYRIFGGYIDAIDPESVQYGEDYLTLNMLGWSALLYERFIAEAYEDENVDDVVKDILDQAEKQAVLGFTTFGVKDVQKKMSALKCDYDLALSKLVEIVEELDLCFNIEPNKDASLYPLGKRFLRYAGWMEDSWEKGWACTAYEFETDGDIAQMKTAAAGGTGTLYRVTLISVDSTVFKKLLLELKGSDVDTQYSMKVVTEDDAEYTVQALTAAPIAYTVKEWDLTGIITGANKNVKNIHLLISKAGSQGILYFKWLGFFPVTPPYQKITLDAATNVHAGAFLREPKKARNMVIVKGDKFTYSVPLDPDEWTKEPAPTIIEEDDETFWAVSAWGTGSLGTPTVSADTVEKVMGAQSTKMVVGAGSYSNWSIKHDYVTPQDWSLKHYIFMWWYGQNTSATFSLALYSGVPYVKFNFVDDFTGWRLLVFNLDDPDIKSGTFDQSSVSTIAVEGSVQGPFRIDEMVLSLARYAWGGEYCALSNDPDAKAGIYSLKATLQAAVLNDFMRKSSGLIKHETFTGAWDAAFWDEGYHGDSLDQGDAYVENNELVCKIWDKVPASGAKEVHAYLISKNPIDLTKGYVFELKVVADLPADKNEHVGLVLVNTHATNTDWGFHAGCDFLARIGAELIWYTQEWGPTWNDGNRNVWIGKAGINSPVLKLIIDDTKVKAYFNNEPVIEYTRQYFTASQGYVRLDADGGNAAMSNFKYEKMDNFKIYKGIKIFVEGLAAGWKVELWSGTNASPGEKKAEAIVPAASSIAELNVLTLIFPFTGFFKVYNDQGAPDHTSPDYSDIWGGDIYVARQTTTEKEHKVYFPRTKDLGINALELKKLKFWFKHNSGDVTETCRLILATDDDNYYYTDFSPVSKWKELFEFDVGWIQNILFENVGSPNLKNLNYIAFLYPKTSAVEWVIIDEFRFEGETEAWGIARDEESIGEIGLQPEKIFSSYYKTQEDALKAADYWLSILKDPPLVKGSLTHPWGLPQLRAGDTIIANVPNENVNNEAMIVKELTHLIPPASTKLTTEISLAGVPHALTDPQKRLKEHIERLTKADVYAENIEILAMPLKENLQITDALTAQLETILTDNMSINDILQALIDALLLDNMSISDILKAELEATLSDATSITDFAEALWQILLSDNISVSDYLAALIEGLLTDNMSISDYLQARWIWDEFANKNDWTVVTGVWSADGILHQTETTTGRKSCKYTGANNFPIDFFVEYKVRAVGNIDQAMEILFRLGTGGPGQNGYAVSQDYDPTSRVKFGKHVNGVWTELASAAKSMVLDTWYINKVDQRDEGTGIRVKVWFNLETSPCINYLDDPKAHSDGEVACASYNETAGAKTDFDYFYMWTE